MIARRPRRAVGSPRARATAVRPRHRTFGFLAIITLIGLTCLAPPATASATASTRAPMFADTLAFSVTSITPEVVTADAGNTLAVRGTVTNSTAGPVTDLIYRIQRGPALTTRSAVEKQLAEPVEPDALVTGWQDFGDDLDAAASGSFGVATAISGGHDNSLRIPRPGIYPVMINVNGTRDVDGTPTDVRVGQVHLLVTVTSVPGRPEVASAIKSQVPTGWIWKLSAPPHRGVGGVFLDESLADAIAPGGRLAERLDAIRTSGLPAGSLTLAVDPLLLDELTAMSAGYWVQQPDVPQGRVTSVPVTSTSSAPGSSTGSAPSSGTNTADDADPGSTAGAAAGDTAADPGSTPTGSTPSGGTPTAGTGSDHHEPAASDESATDGTGDAATPPTTGQPAGSSTAGTPGTPGTATPTTGTTPTGTTESTDAPTTTATTGTEPPAEPPPNTVPGTGQAAATAFLDDLRTVAETTPILVLPYSDPDSVALTRAGEDGILGGLAGIGRSVAQRVFTGPLAAPLITDVALPPDAIADPDTVRAYADQGFRSVVLDGSGVIQSDDKAGDGLARVVTGGGTAQESVPALVDDSPVQEWIDAVLVPTADTTSAQALNGAVAMIARRSFDGDARPLLRLPDAVIDAGGLSDLAAALRLFDADGVIDPVTPADLTTLATGSAVPTDPTVPAKTKQPGTLRVVVPQVDDQTAASLLSPAYLERFADRRTDLTSLRKAFDLDTVAEERGIENLVGSPAPALALLDSLNHSMTPMSSVTLRTAAGHRAVAESVITSVDESVQYLRTGVSLASSVGSYTLAGADSPLLLTVQNTLPYPVMVTVRIDGGDTVGLITEQPDLVALPAESTRQVSIPTTVNRAGSFTVSAQLVGPDGEDWNVSQPLRIRSNAYGAVTIILIAVAGGVLLLMVVLRIWQRWKERQRRLAADADSDSAESADTSTESASDSADTSTESASTDTNTDTRTSDERRRPGQEET